MDKPLIRHYKLLALDIDGVLRNSKGEMSESTVRLLKYIQKQGVYVTIISGKSLSSVRNFALRLGIRNPVICNHGAIVGDPAKNKIFFEVRLPRHALRSIDYMLKRYKRLEAYFFSDNKFFIIDNPHVPEPRRYYTKIGASPDGRYALGTPLEKVLKLLPSKINFYTPIGKEVKYLRILQRYFKGRVNVYRTKPGNVELSPTSVSKGKALRILTRKLGVSLKDVIVVGDEQNDISMVKIAGLGVAMKNAVSELKKVAKYVTQKDNDHGGVEEVINRFILQSERSFIKKGNL